MGDRYFLEIEYFKSTILYLAQWFRDQGAQGGVDLQKLSEVQVRVHFLGLQMISVGGLLMTFEIKRGLACRDN